jgi:hypothetical protein
MSTRHLRLITFEFTALTVTGCENVVSWTVVERTRGGTDLHFAGLSP